MNTLFICKNNRFRSKIAETYFNKINKNSQFKAKSAGLIKGSPISDRIKQTAKKYGLSIKGSPQKIDNSLWKWQDIIVIVADDVPLSNFNKNKYKKKLIVWKIPDTSEYNEKQKEIIIRIIQKRVNNLIKSLRKIY